jgi:menaquinone-9 beta-reductase
VSVAPVDDVTVVGGGPAGAVAALVLARRGHRVRLLERARFPRPKLCGDTLNPGAVAALGQHLDLAALRGVALPLSGMRLSGPRGTPVEGRYPAGVTGLSITRDRLDAWLIAAAEAAGVAVEDGVVVRGAHHDAGQVRGVVAATARGEHRHPCRLVIGADGRGSRLARATGGVRTPRWPRRWALGVYAVGVHEMAIDLGEMHIRGGRYLGLAPVPGGLTNVCLVVNREEAAASVTAPWDAIRGALAGDGWLVARLADARPIARPTILGPMAVDVERPGVAGLLLAGDAAGFIDPMTGDGLRLAIVGGLLAAEVADEMLRGQVSPEAAPRVLAARRARAFRAKWRFNRSLRTLVEVPDAVQAATWAAQVWPALVGTLVRYAGDVGRAA